MCGDIKKTLTAKDMDMTHGIIALVGTRKLGEEDAETLGVSGSWSSRGGNFLLGGGGV